MPTYDKAALRRIYDRTTGKCHICWKKLAFTNYGKFGTRGAWEVEHSNPRAAGGTDGLNNLFAAHITCNRKKRDDSTRSARAEFGRTRAPISVEKRKRARTENTAVGAGSGVVIGGVIAGPPGALIGGSIGALLGNSANPDA